MALVTCALAALLLSVAPVAAQEVPDTSGRPHRAMLDVTAGGYGYLHSPTDGDHRYSAGFSGSYMVPISGTDFDIGIRASFNNLTEAKLGELSSPPEVAENQTQQAKLLSLRLGWFPDRLQAVGDGSSLRFGPYIFAGAGRVKHKRTHLNSTPMPKVRANAVEFGIGIYAGGAFDYQALESADVLRHGRTFGVYYGPEISIVKSFGQAKTLSISVNFVKGGIVF